MPPFDANAIDTNDINVRYHLATLAVAEAMGIPFELAEAIMRDPANKLFTDSMLERARLGEFTYLMNDVPTALTTPTPPAAAQASPQTVDPSTQAIIDATNAGIAERAEMFPLEKEGAELANQQAQAQVDAAAQALKAAEQTYLHAQNAEERADAYLKLQQSQQMLAEATFAAEQQVQRASIAQNLLTTATNLKGPRNYPQFVQATSGGRSIVNQLFGSAPRPAFSAPVGTIEPQNMGALLTDLGLTQGLTGDVAREQGYLR